MKYWEMRAEAPDLWEGYIKVVIDGVLTWIGIEDEGSFRGQASSGKLIHMLEGAYKGKIFRTSNHWYNGEIPRQFREALPDNAEYLSSVDNRATHELWHKGVTEITK